MSEQATPEVVLGVPPAGSPRIVNGRVILVDGSPLLEVNEQPVAWLENWLTTREHALARSARERA